MSISQEQLQKACDWLNNKLANKCYPVAITRKTYAEFIAYIFKMERKNKPSVWYCMEMNSSRSIKQIKRICTKE